MSESRSRKFGEETNKAAAAKEKFTSSNENAERKSFNLSELVTDHTIDLGSVTSSTLDRSSLLSVEEILATSFAPQTRKLRSSLRNSDARLSVFDVTGSSCGSRSFRMAMDGETFAVAGENVESKLLRDEQSWAQEYCAIPTIMSSTRVKAADATGATASFFDQSVIKTPQNASAISMGGYFQMRSDNVDSIIKGKTAYKSHSLFPLIDETTEGNTFTLQTETLKEELKTPVRVHKSSANVREMLSISEIDGVLSDTNMQLDASGSHVVDQIMRKAKKRVSAAHTQPGTSGPSNEQSPQTRASTNSQACQSRAATNSQTPMQSRSKANDTSDKPGQYNEDMKTLAEYLSENKENICSQIMVGGKKSKDSLSELRKPGGLSLNRSPLTNIETGFRKTATESLKFIDTGNMQIADTQNKKHSVQLTSEQNKTPIKVQTRSSRLSASAGKAFPIKVTSLDISWPSTKLRSTIHKTMQIKNITNATFAVRLAIHGAGFQIANSPARILTLQAQECHAITIAFCPTVAGAAHGKLSLSLPLAGKKGQPSLLDIPLYGYGGHASIVIQGILKSPVGDPFLAMGDFSELSQPLRRTFNICNKGPLMGFAMISIHAVGLNIGHCSTAFEVTPQNLTIAAGTSATVNVVFRPERATIRGLAQLRANVINLASMRIVYGDEANRQRIRALLQRMSNVEYAKLKTKALQSLVAKFPGEVGQQVEFAEKANFVDDLLSNLHLYELALTLNRDLLNDSADGDELALADANETLLFRTVCEQPADVSMAEP